MHTTIALLFCTLSSVSVATGGPGEEAADAANGPSMQPREKLLIMLNEGLGLVIHAGHGTDDAWEQCFSVHSLERVSNADRLPVMISAGCSTAICAALGPYQAYIDVDGREHTGTDNGEVFQEPPPPPAAYQTGRCNPSGLGEQLLRRKSTGAVAYIGCNTGSQPCGLTLVDGLVQALAESPQPRLGDCWTLRRRVLLRARAIGPTGANG